MAYLDKQRSREKMASAIAVGLCHALLGYFLITGLALVPDRAPSDALTIFETRTEPPPPPVEEVPPPEPRAKEPEGEASPPNIKSQASPVVAPDPVVKVKVDPPVTAAPKPKEGPDRTAGAAPVAGPGTGSGGTGNGTGSGGSGTGTGGGGIGNGTGSGGVAVRRARLIRGNLSLSDYPRHLRSAGIGGTVAVDMVVEPSGRVGRCSVARTSGSPELDQITCQLVRERYVFDPARDAQGRPVRDYVGERHTWFANRRRGR